MLEFYEYIGLSDNQKAEILWTDGDFITNVVDNGQAFALYALYGFYVEVTLVNDQISEITPFKVGGRLDKYLPQIDLRNR